MDNITYKIVNFDEVEKVFELSYYSPDLIRSPESYEPVKINISQLKNDQSVDVQLSKIAKSMVLSEIEKEKTSKEILNYLEKHLNQYIPFYFVKNGEDTSDIKDRKPEVTFKIIHIDREDYSFYVEPYCSLFKKPEGEYGHQQLYFDGIYSSSEEAIKTYIFKSVEPTILEFLENEKNIKDDESLYDQDSYDGEEIVKNNESSSIQDVSEEKKTIENEVIEMEDYNNNILSFIKNNVGVELNGKQSEKKEPFEFLN